MSYHYCVFITPKYRGEFRSFDTNKYDNLSKSEMKELLFDCAETYDEFIVDNHKLNKHNQKVQYHHQHELLSNHI